MRISLKVERLNDSCSRKSREISVIRDWVELKTVKKPSSYHRYMLGHSKGLTGLHLQNKNENCVNWL